MKILLMYLYIGLTVVAVKASVVSNDRNADMWQIFKAQYGKTYENEVDENFRMQVYLNNSRYINEHNELYAKGEVSFSLRMNKFGDMLPQEFKQIMLKNSQRKKTISADSSCKRRILNVTNDLSKEWDWRDKGAISPVKDQNQFKKCGACWVFSAVAALESHHYIRTKEMVSLSEQNILDCATKGKSVGCEGGYAEDALRYVADNGGIDTDKYYPYKGKTGKCKYNAKYSADKISDCHKLLEDDEKQLKIAVEKVGPVTVAMHADDTLMFFSDGIYMNKYCISHPDAVLNHEILAVGFGVSEKGKEYWLLKNSWGTDWAEKGFFKMIRNADNHCGIASDANYPVA